MSRRRPARPDAMRHRHSHLLRPSMEAMEARILLSAAGKRVLPVTSLPFVASMAEPWFLAGGIIEQPSANHQNANSIRPIDSLVLRSWTRYLPSVTAKGHGHLHLARPRVHSAPMGANGSIIHAGLNLKAETP